MESRQRQKPASPRWVRVGDLEIDLVARTVRRGGQRLPVKGLSFELLACLIERHPELASTREISQAVWGENLVAGATLTQRVKLLRDALSGSPEITDYIETVKSRGYRLAVPLEMGEPPRSQHRSWWQGRLTWSLLLILVLGAVAWLLRPQGPASEAGTHATATLFVLPLSDPGADVEWSEGLRQEIIERLRGIENLSVTPVRELPADTGEDSWALESEWVEDATGAEWIATLRELHSGAVLAQQRVPGAGPGQTPRAVTQAIAEGVSKALPAATLEDDEATAEPPDARAYELYLRARYHGAQYARSDLQRGVQLLDRAVELDPEYARAYELRSMIYSLAGTPSYGWMPPDEAFARARRDALQALVLDSQLANANVTLGNILLWHDWNPVAAEMAYRQATEMAPESISAWLSIALLQTVTARYDDSLRTVSHAIALAPMQAGVHANAGWRLLGARRFEDALAAARRAEALDPTLRDAYNIQVWAEVFLGRIDAARAVPDEYLSDAARGYLLAVGGERGKAIEHVNAMIDARSGAYVPPAAIATVFIGLNEFEQALDWLEAVVEQRSREALFFRSSAIYDPLREHPGFIALMREVGIWDDFGPPVSH